MEVTETVRKIYRYGNKLIVEYPDGRRFRSVQGEEYVGLADEDLTLLWEKTAADELRLMDDGSAILAYGVVVYTKIEGAWYDPSSDRYFSNKEMAGTEWEVLFQA